MVNTKELKKLMIEQEVGYQELADELKIAYSTIRKKILNESYMTLDEAEKLQDFFSIEDDDFTFYFLGHPQRW